MADLFARSARFSLVSPRPIPEALIHHVRHVLESEASDVAEFSPASNDFATRSWSFSHDDAETLRLELRTPAMAMAVDSALITGALAVEGPRLIVSDVDSTFFQDEVLELVARHAGTEEEVREVTTRAMEGRLDFQESLRQRVATIAGQPESVLDEVRAEVRLTAGASDLVHSAHTYGAKVGLISGGFIEVVGPIAEQLGVDFAVANQFATSDGILTGHTSGPVIDAQAKLDQLQAWAAELNIPVSSVVAAGDGANDLPMLGIAGLGIAFMGKAIVVENADCAISFPRLDALCALVGWDVTTGGETKPAVPDSIR